MILKKRNIYIRKIPPIYLMIKTILNNFLKIKLLNTSKYSIRLFINYFPFLFLLENSSSKYGKFLI